LGPYPVLFFFGGKETAVTKTYRVVLLGRSEESPDFEEKMEKLGFSLSHVRDLIARGPSALKGGLALGKAREYAEAVQEAGGRVNILEDGVSEGIKRQRPPMEIRSLKDFTMCPECGHRQIKAEACVKCGFLFFFEKKGQGSAK
jgi:hypothetical protein